MGPLTYPKIIPGHAEGDPILIGKFALQLSEEHLNQQPSNNTACYNTNKTGDYKAVIQYVLTDPGCS